MRKAIAQVICEKIKASFCSALLGQFAELQEPCRVPAEVSCSLCDVCGHPSVFSVSEVDLSLLIFFSSFVLFSSLDDLVPYRQHLSNPDLFQTPSSHLSFVAAACQLPQTL